MIFNYLKLLLVFCIFIAKNKALRAVCKLSTISSCNKLLINSNDRELSNNNYKNRLYLSDKEVPSASEDVKAISNELSKIFDTFVTSLKSVFSYLKVLKDQPEERSKLLEDVKSSITVLRTSVIKNISSGEIGKRGEQWFVLQMVIVGMVLFGVPAFIVHIINMIGGLCVVSGLLLISSGILEVKESLSPFPMPTDDNRLATTGAYNIVRHPMYGGLLLFSSGLSINSGVDSGEKMVLTALLGFVLNYKASIEENILRQIHGKDYDSYTELTPKRFIPYLL